MSIVASQSSLDGLPLTATWTNTSNLGSLVLTRNSAAAGSAGTLSTLAINSAGKLVTASTPANKYMYTVIHVALTTEVNDLSAYVGNYRATITVNNGTNVTHIVTLGSWDSVNSKFTDSDEENGVVYLDFDIDEDSVNNAAMDVAVRVDGGAGTIGTTVSPSQEVLTGVTITVASAVSGR